MDEDATTLLLTSLNDASDELKVEQFARVSADEWRSVVALARQHNVAPLLYQRLKRLDIALPKNLAEELKQEYYRNVLRNLDLYKELGKLLRLLQEKGIAVIVLKGAYLAEAVYDNIGLRTMGDLDLLVKKEDLLRVDQELLALGYEPIDCNRVITEDNYHFAYMLAENELGVEIHWRIFVPNYPFQIDDEGLWDRAQPVSLAETPAGALSPEDLLLHLCLHTAKHAHEMRIRMLCDISEVVRRYGTQLDWQEIGRRARQWGVLRAVYVILRLAWELLGVAVPVDWLTSLRPGDFDERYLDLTRKRIIDTPMAGMINNIKVAKMWEAKGFSRKLAVIRASLLPSRDVMALKYPASANSWRIYLYYPVRIKYVLLRHSMTVWRLVRGDPKTQSVTEQVNEVVALRDWLMSG